MKRIYSSVIIALSLVSLFSCDISNNEADPAATFAKIYDDQRFEQEYYPLSIIQSSDDGFLILSELKNDNSLFTSVYVLKTDAAGNIEQATVLPAPNGLPVPGWSVINGQYYFVCMNTSSFLAQVVAVDPDGSVGTPQVINGITYPLVSAPDGNSILLLSYNNLDGNSVLSQVGTDGSISRLAQYSIGAGVDVEKPIIDHLTRNGPKLPFSVGRSGGSTYYFNGLYNYTFSMVFTSFGDDPTGVCQGQLSLGGISAVHSLGGNNYAIARYNFGANFINPAVQISANALSSSVDLGGNTFPEIETDAIVAIREHEESQNLIYGTHTNSRRLVLYGYTAEDGSITGTQYLGAGNPYLFADFTFTSDGGIAILSQVALEGRFPRIALFKRDAGFVKKLK
jgi:hypothetical protein